MAVHLIKLCVGIREVAELADFQARRLAREGHNFHVTRMVPRRAAEIVDGGSLYWVIAGMILVRQRITAIESFTDAEGVRRCRLGLDPTLVPVVPQPRRAFQGWRYLKPEDAPADLEIGEGDDPMPEAMRREQAELGLL